MQKDIIIAEKKAGKQFKTKKKMKEFNKSLPYRIYEVNGRFDIRQPNDENPEKYNTVRIENLQGDFRCISEGMMFTDEKYKITYDKDVLVFDSLKKHN